MSTIGSRIKELRLRRGFTQDQIAEKLDMNRANFSHYERDNAVPPADTLGKIADILNTTSDYLLGRNEISLVDDEINTLSREISDLTTEDIELLKTMVKTMSGRKKYSIDK